MTEQQTQGQFRADMSEIYRLGATILSSRHPQLTDDGRDIETEAATAAGYIRDKSVRWIVLPPNDEAIIALDAWRGGAP